MKQKQEIVKGVINNIDNTAWKRNQIKSKENLRKSALEKSIDYYYNIKIEEINIVSKAIALLLILPEQNGINIKFNSLGFISKNLIKITIFYKNNNIGFSPAGISLLDFEQSNLCNSDEFIKILNTFFYKFINCSKDEQLHFKRMLISYIKSYLILFKDFPLSYINRYKNLYLKISDGKIDMYLSKNKKNIKSIMLEENK